MINFKALYPKGLLLFNNMQIQNITDKKITVEAQACYAQSFKCHGTLIMYA